MALSPMQSAIVQALRDHPHGLTPKQLAEIVGSTGPESIKVIVHRMRRVGIPISKARGSAQAPRRDEQGRSQEAYQYEGDFNG